MTQIFSLNIAAVFLKPSYQNLHILRFVFPYINIISHLSSSSMGFANIQPIKKYFLIS